MQVLPQEGSKQGCYFEEKTELWPAFRITCMFPLSQAHFPGCTWPILASPTAPLLQERQQILSQVPVPAVIPSFRQHGSTCWDCS